MKRSIIFLVAVYFTTCVFAFDFSVDGVFYKIKTPASTNRVAVTAGSNTGNSYSGTIDIPLTVNYNSKSYSVTEIDAFAFGSCYSLTDITIPTSIDTISDGAFWGCIKMTALAIPASVKKIGSYVFIGDTVLTDITVDAANAYFKSDQGILYNRNLNVLLSYPAGKPALSYTIPNTVDSIGDFAFSYCKFTSVTIPNSVKYMNHGTFSMCYGLTIVNIPASVLFLRNNPFYDCKNMMAVTIDSDNLYNQSVDGVIFKKETGRPLETLIYYPPAKQGSSYIIPNTVTYVRSSTFMNCLNLTSVTIPASVTTIRSGMLQGCKNLISINAYSSVPVDLTSIVPGNNSDKVFDGVDTIHCVLHVPVGSKSLYASAYQWKGFSNIVEGFTSEFTAIKTSNLKVTAHNQQIQLSGYIPNELITVYNTQGLILYNKKASATTTTIKLNYKGLVVVTAGTDKVKVILF